MPSSPLIWRLTPLDGRASGLRGYRRARYTVFDHDGAITSIIGSLSAVILVCKPISPALHMMCASVLMAGNLLLPFWT